MMMMVVVVMVMVMATMVKPQGNAHAEQLPGGLSVENEAINPKPRLDRLTFV